MQILKIFSIEKIDYSGICIYFIFKNNILERELKEKMSIILKIINNMEQNSKKWNRIPKNGIENPKKWNIIPELEHNSKNWNQSRKIGRKFQKIE